MFSCEFREISKNNFFTEHLWTTASASWWKARKRKRCWVINKSHKKNIKIAASIDFVNTVKLCCNYCKYWHWTWCKLNQYCIMIGLWQGISNKWPLINYFYKPVATSCWSFNYQYSKQNLLRSAVMYLSCKIDKLLFAIQRRVRTQRTCPNLFCEM